MSQSFWHCRNLLIVTVLFVTHFVTPEIWTLTTKIQHVTLKWSYELITNFITLRYSQKIITPRPTRFFTHLRNFQSWTTQKRQPYRYKYVANLMTTLRTANETQGTLKIAMFEEKFERRKKMNLLAMTGNCWTTAMRTLHFESSASSPIGGSRHFDISRFPITDFSRSTLETTLSRISGEESFNCMATRGSKCSMELKIMSYQAGTSKGNKFF